MTFPIISALAGNGLDEKRLSVVACRFRWRAFRPEGSELQLRALALWPGCAALYLIANAAAFELGTTGAASESRRAP